MARVAVISSLAALLLLHGVTKSDEVIQRAPLKVGVASVSITPFGPSPEWDGTVTDSGVWGEKFTDRNHNGRWDPGEPFEDDPENDQLDLSSKGKYDGIYLAGFGENRLASGKHDDLWARAMVLESGPVKIAIVSLDLIGYYSSAKYYGPHGPDSVGTRCSASGSGFPLRTRSSAEQRVPTIEFFHTFRGAGGCPLGRVCVWPSYRDIPRSRWHEGFSSLHPPSKGKS